MGVITANEIMGYIDIYLDYFGYSDGEYVPCEVCGSRAVDVHHIVYRSHGGGDNIGNLMALCRDCHVKAHSGRLSGLREIHDKYLETQNKKSTGIN